MSERIIPALSPEEWANHLDHRRRWLFDAEHDTPAHRIEWARTRAAHCLLRSDPDPHAAAALCLYQQPFGFTQEDVTMLRRLSEVNYQFARPDAGATLLALADRIAALLPPPQP